MTTPPLSRGQRCVGSASSGWFGWNRVRVVRGKEASKTQASGDKPRWSSPAEFVPVCCETVAHFAPQTSSADVTRSSVPARKVGTGSLHSCAADLFVIGDKHNWYRMIGIGQVVQFRIGKSFESRESTLKIVELRRRNELLRAPPDRLPLAVHEEKVMRQNVVRVNSGGFGDNLHKHCPAASRLVRRDRRAERGPARGYIRSRRLISTYGSRRAELSTDRRPH